MAVTLAASLGIRVCVYQHHRWLQVLVVNVLCDCSIPVVAACSIQHAALLTSAHTTVIRLPFQSQAGSTVRGADEGQFHCRAVYRPTQVRVAAGGQHLSRAAAHLGA